LRGNILRAREGQKQHRAVGIMPFYAGRHWQTDDHIAKVGSFGD
jgi:hypothetical protein